MHEMVSKTLAEALHDMECAADGIESCSGPEIWDRERAIEAQAWIAAQLTSLSMRDALFKAFRDQGLGLGMQIGIATDAALAAVTAHLCGEA